VCHHLRIAAVALTLGGLVRSSCSNATTEPTTSLAGRQATYVRAVSELKSYLVAWRQTGPFEASNDYLVRSQQGGKVKLLSGSLTSYTPYSWSSKDVFTLLVDLDLHFSGWPGALNVGHNDRFVTFTWSKLRHRYLMEFKTGP
jgi:hypothetical protein